MPDFQAKHLFPAACAALLPIAAAASAQDPAPEPLTVVAVPPLPTPRNDKTEEGETGVIGILVAEQIARDLQSSGAFLAIPPGKLKAYTATEAGAPIHRNWTSTGAGALVTGYVQARSDGRITIACYLHDLKERREMARRGFAVTPSEWRRAAHRCADSFYARVTGQPGYFDTRIAYVAETGPRSARVKRIAVMDHDGSGHHYLTAGEVTVLSPRFSPDGERIAYVGFSGGVAHVRIVDIDGSNDRPLVGTQATSFAPRFSPDGRFVVFSMAVGGNTDIYVASAEGGYPQRITTAPGVDTGPAFSPDGSQIVFESDRSGSQQLYVMNADGSAQRRISFGGGAYASPAWSPDGKRIAFSRSAGGNSQVGLMSPSGADERLLTTGWQDEAPSWAPSSRLLVFQRTQQGSGIARLYTVPVSGGEPAQLATPQPGSDPAWSGASE